MEQKLQFSGFAYLILQYHNERVLSVTCGLCSPFFNLQFYVNLSIIISLNIEALHGHVTQEHFLKYSTFDTTSAIDEYISEDNAVVIWF